MSDRLTPVSGNLDEVAHRYVDALTGGPRGATIVGKDGKLIGPFDAWLRRPELGSALGALGEVLRFRGMLTPATREIVILTVATRWKAEFEFFAHARFARDAGVSDAVIDAIASGVTPPFEDDADRLAHELTLALGTTGTLSDTEYRDAVASFGEPATVELVILVGYYGLVSYTLNAFHVALPEGVSARWT